jgi:hypothetical protein
VEVEVDLEITNQLFLLEEAVEVEMVIMAKAMELLQEVAIREVEVEESLMQTLTVAPLEEVELL